MSYSKKLHYFFKGKNISNKELAERLEISETMIGRYQKGDANFNPTFLVKLKNVFPEINLNYIFSEEEENREVAEGSTTYHNEMNVIDELRSIQERIELIKDKLK
jgi:transcriptional regulator with XRE-family HTH domain